MNECTRIRGEFSEYLDGAVSGAAMQKISTHLESCISCAEEFSDWKHAQMLLGSIGRAKAPPDLGLRLRISLSKEAAQTGEEYLARWQVRWQNNVKPLLLHASAGLASTILLVGSVSLLIGMFASPEPLSAWDQPLGVTSEPRFLYSSVEPEETIGDRDNPVVVEAFIDGQGRVYDYKIVAGKTDMKTQSEIATALLFSAFSPATTFGQPVRGVVLLSFSGVSVKG